MEAHLIDVAVVFLCLIAIIFMVKAYLVTRAAGLGFLALGFLWSMGVRLFILGDDNFVRFYSREFVLPSFLFFSIGSVLMFYSLLEYYSPGKQDKSCIYKLCQKMKLTKSRPPEEEDV